MFEPRIIALCIVGLGLIIAVSLERLLERWPLSVPMVYVGVGWAVFSLPLGLPAIDPVGQTQHTLIAEYLSEFVVIVSLMTAGLAIDRAATWKLWKRVWPLLAITMPLTIGLVAVAGWAWLALSPAAAILLGAVLSPTDPVLADGVQVRPPNESERHDVRFMLTVEAGINDSLAFPFTYLAIASIGVAGLGAWTLEWFALDVVWRLLAGGGVGYLIGKATSWYVFGRVDRDSGEEDEKSLLRQRREGLVALGTVLASYSVAEIVEGYGFLAVFVAAVSLRQSELSHGYHSMMHRFVDQVEQITMLLMMVGFGGLIASGILAPITWAGAILAVSVVLIIRPIAGMLGLARNKLPLLGRLIVAFAGIRGIGSIYYLAYAQNNADFGDLRAAWAIVAMVVLVSLVVHGTTVSGLMRLAEANEAHRLGEHVPGKSDGQEK